MTRLKYLITGLFLLAIIITYFIFRDNLPPRTPWKIARNISNLNITNDYLVSNFSEEWSEFNGDGSLRMEIALNDEQLSDLIKECNERGYQNLPINDPPSELDGALFLKGMEGLYKIRIHDERESAFDLAILDITGRKLRIYVFVS